MSNKDYYRILDVDRGASAEEIKKAYRKAALKFHPDRNPGNPEAEQNFKLAAEAYAALSDPEKRRIYDLYGADALTGTAGPRGFSSFEEIFSAFGDIFGGDLFGSFFGFGESASRGGRRGASLRCQVEIGLEEVDSGVEKTIQLQRNEICEACAGSGAATGTEPRACPTCRGAGQIEATQGFLRIRTVCPRCGGQGSVIEKPCPKCRGTARVKKRRSLRIKVPPGIDDGTQIRLSGEGEPGIDGAPRGDLYCEIRVKGHAYLQRRGDDLFMEVPISFTQAALGAEIRVPGLTGDVDLSIPRGTNAGEVVRLRGHGLPNLRGGRRGDLHVRLTIEVPAKLTAEQEKLLRTFAQTEHLEVKPRKRGLFEKFKDWLE